VTTTATRQSAGVPLLLLPLAVIVALFGVSVLLSQIAPSRATAGVYQVTVGTDAAQVTIPGESLTCGRSGNTATCDRAVGGRELWIEVSYTGVHPAEPSSCTATHGGRPVVCHSRMGDYGHASHSVWIADGLGLTDTGLAALRADVPWWRTGYYDGLTIAGLVLTGMFSIAAGGSVYLSRKRSSTVAPKSRAALTIGTGLLALGLFVLSGLVFGQNLESALFMLLAPPTLLSAAVLVAWQLQLTGTGHGTRRWVPAIGAAVATAIYATTALFIFMLQSGFWD
jgi:hypothetical protein